VAQVLTKTHQEMR